MRAKILWTTALASMLCALALGLSALAGAAGRQSGGPSLPASSWTTLSAMPQGLYGAAAASNGTYSYAAGGYSSTGTTLDTFYRYNPVNERWETLLPPMPTAAAMASAVYYPTTNKIYVFGGMDPNTSVFSNATRVFDLTTSTWSTAANMPGARASMASGYNSANGRIYLVGGNNTSAPTSAQAQTWEYNPAANTFTTRASIPNAVGGPASGVIAGHLYVAGGRDAAGAVIGLVWDYNISTNSWTAKASMPNPTNVPGSAAASGKLWSFGGTNPSTPTATTVAYNPVTNSWAQAPSMDAARSSVAGTAIGSRLVAAGGHDGSAATAVTEIMDAGTATCPALVTTFNQNFDGVTPPALPAGWTATNAQGSAPLWETSSTGFPTPPADSAPNAAFIDSAGAVSDKRLDSPSIPITTSSAQLTFRNNHYTETTFDGGVLEISINGGAFQDIVVAGGTFVVGTYNGTLSNINGNPIGGRLTWTGNSQNGFVTTTLNLPPSAAGQNIVLRWRLGTDTSVGAPGWRIDSIRISECRTRPTHSAPATASPKR